MTEWKHKKERNIMKEKKEKITKEKITIPAKKTSSSLPHSAELLISFLEHKNVLGKFIKNSLNEFGEITTSQLCWNFGTAFSFSASPEGEDFWHNLYSEWLEYAESYHQAKKYYFQEKNA